MTNEFKQLYPTNVLFGSFADYPRLTELVTELLTMNDLFQPVGTKYLLGEVNIFDQIDQLPETRQFKAEIVETAFNSYLSNLYNKSLSDYSGYKLKAWMSGEQMSVHNHNNSHFSGVFYISTEDNMGGYIEFYDPRVNANRGYQNELLGEFTNTRITPKTGDFIVFPSYLYHAVLPFYGKLRLSMPVDLFLNRN
jgi:hypothetical protein